MYISRIYKCMGTFLRRLKTCRQTLEYSYLTDLKRCRNSLELLLQCLGSELSEGLKEKDSRTNIGKRTEKRRKAIPNAN